MGLTPDLTVTGKIVISVMMFIGRIGPLTLVFALAKRQNKAKFRYAEERIMIG
jgi:trk system potassium uptake protein TrkH